VRLAPWAQAQDDVGWAMPSKINVELGLAHAPAKRMAGKVYEKTGLSGAADSLTIVFSKELLPQ